MITLTVDAREGLITVEDNEVEQVSRNDELGLGRGFELWYNVNDEKEQLEFSKVAIPVDLEGFVFTLIDKNGNRWTTEIIGQVGRNNG